MKCLIYFERSNAVARIVEVELALNRVAAPFIHSEPELNEPDEALL